MGAALRAGTQHLHMAAAALRSEPKHVQPLPLDLRVDSAALRCDITQLRSDFTQSQEDTPELRSDTSELCRDSKVPQKAC